MKHWTHWQTPVLAPIPAALRDWLTDTGSLTRQLQQVCQQSFSVALLQSGWQRPLPDESLLLHQPLGQRMFTREVQLLDGAQPQVYARSLVPVSTYHAKRARFDALGNQSLGEMLFNDPQLERGPIQVACLQPGQPLFNQASRYLQQTPSQLWARRSCFYLAGKAMLVNEVFLPADKWSEL
jgi:chorismate--pyruvate lyase